MKIKILTRIQSECEKVNCEDSVLNELINRSHIDGEGYCYGIQVATDEFDKIENRNYVEILILYYYKDSNMVNVVHNGINNHITETLTTFDDFKKHLFRIVK